MPAFDLRGDTPGSIEGHAYYYGIDGHFIPSEEVQGENAYRGAPSLHRLEYFRQFAPHAQDCFCEFSGHNCRFVFRAPRAPVRAPGAIGFNVLELH